MNLLSPEFTDADAARKYLESVRWPDGPKCPHCSSSKAYTITRKKKSAKTREGLYKCADCRKQYTVTVGTIFEASKVALNKWLLAAYLIASSKKGFSAHQLHRNIGVTYKTAWFMFHRLREAMNDPAFLDKLGGEGKVVEADETYWGNTRSKDVDVRRGAHHKEKVVVLVERGGNVRTFHVAKVTGKELTKILRENVDPNTEIRTDESGVYSRVRYYFKGHKTVTHGVGQYVSHNDDGSPYNSTNAAEGVASLLKRGLNGTFHHVSPAHLRRYLAEFDFRYNERNSTDSERTDALLRSTEGKRLLYRISS